jgi:hypothetical protein
MEELHIFFERRGVHEGISTTYTPSALKVGGVTTGLTKGTGCEVTVVMIGAS